MSGRCFAALTVAIALFGVSARGSLRESFDPDPEALRRMAPGRFAPAPPPDLPDPARPATQGTTRDPPPCVPVPKAAITFSVHASGTVRIGGVLLDGRGVLARLRAHADRSRDAEGVSREAMAVVADAGTPWRAVRDVLSLCSHPDVRIERVFVGTSPASAIRILVPRDRLPPRGVKVKTEIEPRLTVSLRRYSGMTVVDLLDANLGDGERGLAECDRRIGGIHERNPEVPGEIRAGDGTPLREVLRAHAMFGAREIEVRIHRVPADCWELEEFYREVEACDGPELCRVLLRALDHGDWRVTYEAGVRLADLWRLGRHREELLAGIREALRSESDRLQGETLDALEIFEEPWGLGPVVPEVVALFDSGSMFIPSRRVELLLAKIGSPAAEYIARVEVPLALEILRRMGRQAAFGLLRALDDPDAAVRTRAAELLSFIAPRGSKPAVPRLVRAAREDPEREVRSAAVRALGRHAGKLPPALAALHDALVDRDAWVRAEAAALLVRLGEGTTRALAVLRRDVLNGERAAAFELRCLRNKAEPAVPDLIASLSVRDTCFRLCVVDALGRIAPGRPEVRRALERVAGDETEDPQIREAARELIRG